MTTEATETAMLAVLRRLLSAPDGQRLYGNDRARGVFSSNSPGSRRLVDQLQNRGYLTVDTGEDGRPIARLTQAGRQWVVETENPRLLLEDLARAAESQRDSLRKIESACRAQRDALERQIADVRHVLERVHLPAANADHLMTPRIVEILRDHAGSDKPSALTLAELFHALRFRQPELSIGQFHDLVRFLHESGSLQLTPWTGALYQLPEPELALLIGHEVLYYVRLARTHAA